ncbi:hypothetical protein BV25DRAFT_1833444 [Artomyces pyxidatus]|uniref:Uncharacterized protein n=1 Tax=Artomyces pyxidatus TaxID=48021 RepID=A0ACB8SGG1_9AGAM|nr:hypothetical protein BV25DRAFT_1833444 [Artomyces pyxidatus]
MTDLLPPSPSAPSISLKPFLATPSNLNPHFPAEYNHTPTSGSHVVNGFPKSHGTPVHSPFVTPVNPEHLTDTSAPIAQYAALHRRNGSVASSTASPRAPIIRPLDFRAVMSSHEETHAELGRIVDDLVQWLSITEVGLTKVLDSAGEDRIEEEQEETLGTVEVRAGRNDSLDSNDIVDDDLALAAR